jgi:response regulator RpfG family c-di-GMP phosphodiesterase
VAVSGKGATAVKQILVVDDEHLLLQHMVRELSQGYRVLPARSFEEALSILDGQPALSAVVSDWCLGGGRSGIDLLAMVKQQNPACARLLISGYPESEALATALAGDVVQRFLGKGWGKGDLLRAVRKQVDAGAEDLESEPPAAPSE